MLRTRQPLTIREAARELGVSPGWLRFGERLGSLLLARPREGWEPEFEEITCREIERLAPPTAEVEREHDE